MSRINSRAKGQRGEREVIDLLQPIVTECYSITLGIVGRGASPHPPPPTLQRNSLQADRGGSIGNADIAGLDFLAIEVKNQAHLDVETWWRQCAECAKNSRTGAEPVLIYKAGHGKWRARLKGSIGFSVSEVRTVCDVGLEPFLQWFRARCLEHFSDQRGIQSGELESGPQIVATSQKPPLPAHLRRSA